MRHTNFESGELRGYVNEDVKDEVVSKTTFNRIDVSSINAKKHSSNAGIISDLLFVFLIHNP